MNKPGLYLNSWIPKLTSPVGHHICNRFPTLRFQLLPQILNILSICFSEYGHEIYRSSVVQLNITKDVKNCSYCCYVRCAALFD